MTTQDQSEHSLILNAYDEIPYHNHPLSQSQPAHLAAVANLFGLVVPGICRARVLELGCADGSNLIPFATNWPESRCVGVDISAREIADGQKIVAELALGNCDLRHASITDITPDWGEFDYIICRGVWSWVPEEVRAHIFRVCRDNLAYDGVAYVNYNTYPGWHMRGAIRDLMRWHTSLLPDSQQKVQQARAVLQFMCDSTQSEGDAYGLMLRNEARLIAQQGEYNFLYDYLEEVNHPVYVHEFFAQCAANGLEYLAEADVKSMLPAALPPATVDTLRRIAPDIVRMEQYLDYLRNRTLRQTLLIKQGRVINRNLDASSLEQLAVVSSAMPRGEIDLSQSGRAQFMLLNGTEIGAVNSVTKAALLELGERFRQPVTYPELLDAARLRLQPTPVSLPDPATRSQDASLLGADLLQLYFADAIEIWPQIRLPLAQNIPAEPLAFPLARIQAQRIPAGVQGIVTTVRHENVLIDALSARVLTLLDGTRDRPAILNALELLLEENDLNLQRDGKPVTDSVLRRGMLVTRLDAILHDLRSKALLISS